MGGGSFFLSCQRPISEGGSWVGLVLCIASAALLKGDVGAWFFCLASAAFLKEEVRGLCFCIACAAFLKGEEEGLVVLP
jgi:hypothetical protein